VPDIVGLLMLPREHPVARTQRQENREGRTTIRLDIVNTSSTFRVEWQYGTFFFGPLVTISDNRLNHAGRKAVYAKHSFKFQRAQLDNTEDFPTTPNHRTELPT
jgi:hypothetical protein